MHVYTTGKFALITVRSATGLRLRYTLPSRDDDAIYHLSGRCIFVAGPMWWTYLLVLEMCSP